MVVCNICSYSSWQRWSCVYLSAVYCILYTVYCILYICVCKKIACLDQESNSGPLVNHTCALIPVLCHLSYLGDPLLLIIAVMELFLHRGKTLSWTGRRCSYGWQWVSQKQQGERVVFLYVGELRAHGTGMVRWQSTGTVHQRTWVHFPVCTCNFPTYICYGSAKPSLPRGNDTYHIAGSRQLFN